MKRWNFAVALSALLVALWITPASGALCERNELGTYEHHVQRCVVEDVAPVGEPTSWLPFAAGALVLGTAIAVWLLQKGRERVWRTEDEAWAELLGPDAI